MNEISPLLYGRGHPLWLVELLATWAARAAAPSTVLHPMWRKAREAEVDLSYTSEVHCLDRGIERLKTEHPDGYDLILAAVQPWVKHKTVGSGEGGPEDLDAALRFLEEWLDSEMGK